MYIGITLKQPPAAKPAMALAKISKVKDVYERRIVHEIWKLRKFY